MRYPKQWDAESTSVYCSSSKTKNTPREYFLCLSVYRPGTIHHTRRIVAQMSYADLFRLSKQIQAQLAHNDDEIEGGLTT